MPVVININLKVTSFGQVVFQVGKPTPPIEARPIVPAHEEIRYRQPLETASRIYDVRYQEELTNYVVPLSTA